MGTVTATLKTRPQRPGGAILRSLVGLAAGSAALLAAAPAWAAGGDGDPWMDFLWKTVNFSILVGLLYLVLRKPVATALRAAAERAMGTLGDARENAEQMAQQLESQRRTMESLQAELERLREDARKDTEEEAERLKSEAQATAERLKSQVSGQVEQARAQALAAIRADLADEAVKMAETLIRGKVDSKAQKRLVVDHIQRLENRP